MRQRQARNGAPQWTSGEEAQPLLPLLPLPPLLLLLPLLPLCD